MATLVVRRRFDLTDARWALLERLLPVTRRPGRPSKWMRRRGTKATIPAKPTRTANRRAQGSKAGRPPGFDFTLYRQRHAAECGINQFNHHRVMATRRQARRPLRSTLRITAIKQGLRSLRDTS